MKALSILQPWAWLIVHGYKDIENRNWKTAFRGRILIHAGKRWGREQKDDLEWIRQNFPTIPLPDSFELGGIVGAATVTDCVDQSSSRWFFGEYGFVLAEPATCGFVPWRGQLGFFDIPRSALAAEFPAAQS